MMKEVKIEKQQKGIEKIVLNWRRDRNSNFAKLMGLSERFCRGENILWYSRFVQL